MRNRRINIILLLNVFLVVNAQEKVPNEIPTPNAASLGRYGDYPVSYYTGNVGVNIPLYSFSIRDVELPITLNYDASGMQMNSLPSWTGMNWTLNCGGVIMRQRCGEYDEQIFPSQAHINYNRYFNSYTRLPSVVNNQSLLWNEVYTFQDMAPDIFSFNFMGKTGKFFLGNDGQWKVKSNENLEVIFDITDASNYISPLFTYYPKYNAGDPQPKVIKGFTIRDDNGTSYVFGGTNEAIDYTTEFFNMSVEEDVVSWHPTSWYLTKVIDKYGQDLYSFTYQRGKYAIQVYNIYQNVSNYNYYYWHNIKSLTWNDGYNEFPYGVTLNSPVYLTQIRAANGVQVDFSIADNPVTIKTMYSVLYSDGVDKLYERMARRVSKWCEKYPPDNSATFGYFMAMPGAFYYLQIDESGNLGTEAKKDILSYAGLKYLSSITVKMNTSLGASNSILKYSFIYNYSPRMVLSSIVLLGGNTLNVIGNYEMKYFNLNQIPASYLTKAIDHWGYYNGNEYGFLDDYYTKRNPNAERCKYGMLSEIVYPTGGCSVFDYEAHTFSKRMSYDRQNYKDSIGIAGGVRIKSITEYDDENHNNMIKKRTFSYNNMNTSQSSGVLAAPPRYIWNHWQQKIFDSSGNEYATSYFDLKRTSSIIPLSNSFGPHVGYSYVEEQYLDGTKKAYGYSNYADPDCQDIKSNITFMTNRPSPFEEYSERGYKRGNLLYEKWYDSMNHIVKMIENEYRNDSFENKDYVYSTNMEPMVINSSYRTIVGVVYKLFYPRYDLYQVTETQNTSNGAVVTKKTFSNKDTIITMLSPYVHTANLRLLCSDSISRKEQKQFNLYSYSGFTGTSPASKYLNSMFCISPRSISTYNNETLVSTTTTEYKEISVTTSSNTTSQVIVPALETVTFNGGTKDTLITYDLYTTRGAIQKYTKGGEPSIWQKWAYNDIYLMMKGTAFYNGTFVNMFNRSSCLNTIKNYITSSGGLVTGYVYSPVQGITAIVEPNGNVTYYNYDGFGRLSEIRNNENQLLKRYEYKYRTE